MGIGCSSGTGACPGTGSNSGIPGVGGYVGSSGTLGAGACGCIFPGTVVEIVHPILLVFNMF